MLSHFSSVQFSHCHVCLVATPWTTDCQASLSIINGQSLPNPCLLSRWCLPTISSSVIPFSSCSQSFPASGSFQMSFKTNLDSILKSRDITLSTKVHLFKAMFCGFFYYYYFYFILLYNTVLVFPYIDMNPPREYMHSQTRTPLPPPSP